MDKHKQTGVALHQLAVATAISTLALVAAGGLVTTEGAGMAVPDWPKSFGYNMFALPLTQWVGGVLYEHSHRLIGSAVGALSLALTVVVWLRERRRGIQWLATAVLLAVIAQGVLGGLRVLLVSPHLAMVHAVMAQTFFGLTVALAVISSPRWRSPGSSAPAARSLIWPIAPAATALVYVQMILGVITRHTRMATAEHITGAMLVFLAAVFIVYETSRNHAGDRALVGTAWTMLALCMAQFATGLTALVMRADRLPDAPLTALQAAAPTAHVTLGALIFGAGIVLTLCAWKRRQPEHNRTPALAPTPSAQSSAQA